MQIPISLFVGFAALCLGIAVLSANPSRFTNQVFFLVSVIILLNTWTVYRATVAGILFRQGLAANPVPWIRANCAITAFLPWVMWLLKESLLAPEPALRTFSRSLPWFVLGVVLALICVTHWYIPADSVPTQEKRGPGYIVSAAILSVAYICVVFRTGIQLRDEFGIRRIELQFFVLNLGIAALLTTALNTAGNLFHFSELKRVGLVVILISYALTAWALSYYRVFNVRQVFLALGQRLAVVLTLSFGTVVGWRYLESQLSAPLDLVISVALSSSLAFPLDRMSRRWLRLGNEDTIADWRAAVILVARAEPDPEKLLTAFETLLCERCGASFAKILYERGDAHTSDALTFSRTQAGHETLCKLGWATPESLQRRRATGGVHDLREFLDQNMLGLIVTAPRGSPTPSLVLALGTKTSRWPFTYPEIQRVQNLAELMDNILTHARLTAQAALKAKMEHLALMSRGLAHDLKNLITPVSAFIMHTDGRATADTAEAEVHAAAKRSVQMMTDYIREALFFASRLTPNFERVELTTLLKTVRELTSARAALRNVEVIITSSEPFALTVDVVLLQRLVANLVNNAIDASTQGGKIKLHCSERESGWVRIEVLDEGCGIPRENLGRIFEPYFTTKHFGDDVRGFGLGLTICEKIVDLHQGTIHVRSEVGRGTNVMVDLPAAPSAFSVRADVTAPA